MPTQKRVKTVNRLLVLCSYLFLTALIFLILWDIQFQTSYLVGHDAWYHIKMAEIFLKNGLIHKFPWLYYTTLNQNYIDHQFIFHLILIPFYLIFGAVQGLKIYTVASLTTVFILVYYLLRYYKIKLALVWTLLLFTVPYDFFFRMNLGRIMSLALIFMLLGLHWAFQKKYVLLAILSFLFVWTYGGFVYLPVLIAIYFLVQYLRNGQVDWKLLLFCFGGTLAGTILNPFFPNLFKFLYTQIFSTGLGNIVPGTGGEWGSYKAWQITSMGIVTFGIATLAVLISFLKNLKQDSRAITFFSISLLFLFLMLKAMRFVEYWPVFAILASAFLLNPWLSQITERWKTKKDFFVLLPVLAVLFFCFNYSTRNITRVKQDMRISINYKTTEQTMDFLKQKSQAGDIVFTDDWDVFPFYFFFNDKNYYIVGLDPAFLYDYSSDLGQKFSALSSGRDGRNLQWIKTDFNARWVVVHDRHQSFESNLRQKPDQFEPMFENSDYAIFKVL
ncbi:hypothetical protein AUJ78_00595 [Candidatus Peregrinibacteria bacterium CG1_02_41_10]|nr:MAG: hypothetical protein AUJ78_00595 [Candidatus Peregrinibacteria bacterium CG1_02_41_10]